MNRAGNYKADSSAPPALHGPIIYRMGNLKNVNPTLCGKHTFLSSPKKGNVIEWLAVKQIAKSMEPFGNNQET